MVIVALHTGGNACHSRCCWSVRSRQMLTGVMWVTPVTRGDKRYISLAKEVALRIFLYVRVTGWGGHIQSLWLYSCGVSWSRLHWLLDTASNWDNNSRILYSFTCSWSFLLFIQMWTTTIYLHQLLVALSFVTLLLIENQIIDRTSKEYLSHGQLLTIIIMPVMMTETSDLYSVMHYYG